MCSGLENSPSGEFNVSCVNAENCVLNTPLPITYAMSDNGDSGRPDIDVQSQWPFMIPILTDYFRCVMCALRAVNIWSPPLPRFSTCTYDLVSRAQAIEETDNEEDVEGEHVAFPRNRRDLKADATLLWHLLTHNP